MIMMMMLREEEEEKEEKEVINWYTGAVKRKEETVSKVIKGSVSRDFRPPFFHDSNPPGPLINRLK